MERHGFEELASHKDKHERVVAKVLEYQRRVDAQDARIMDELLEFLNDWLSGHIKGTDKKYGVVLNAKGGY